MIYENDQTPYSAVFDNPDEGVDEDAPVENGEVSIFELAAEQDRSTLAQWADRIIPGTDVVALNLIVRVGDLVLHRPGSIGFEVFSKADRAAEAEMQYRMSVLGIAAQAIPDMPGEHNLVEFAGKLMDWVQGD